MHIFLVLVPCAERLCTRTRCIGKVASSCKTDSRAYLWQWWQLLRLYCPPRRRRRLPPAAGGAASLRKCDTRVKASREVPLLPGWTEVTEIALYQPNK